MVASLVFLTRHDLVIQSNELILLVLSDVFYANVFHFIFGKKIDS